MTDIPQKVIADPATHYGSGKAATRGFRVQRITAAVNVVVLLFLVWFVASLGGADRDLMVAAIRNPVVAILLAAMTISVPIHMRIGMREIIEDYVHEPRVNRLCLMLNSYVAIVIAAVGLLSIIKIFIWG